MPYLPQIFLMLLQETLCIKYDYMALGFDFIGGGLGTCGALVIRPITDLPGGPV